MMERFKAALRLHPQNVVYASTTRGGMKVLYEGHYFKYVYKRYDCGVFQCCYNENNEQCKARIIINRNLVYPLDGVHNHFNQATDKSVTSVLIEAGDACDEEDNVSNDGAQLKTISQKMNLAETNEFVVMEVRESVADANLIPLQTISLDEDYEYSKGNNVSEDTSEIGNDIFKKNADDLREKIKKRLQQALMKKKK
ncbi:modifier of mdg4 [Eupeodes corollae]|uniref:modifier of mdg4 n=1 Tax=Eupeodes corollae TaxID=290404 RepID=UPI002493A5E9|nr:modifier of mdg4 [Eupeodes corollae]